MKRPQPLHSLLFLALCLATHTATAADPAPQSPENRPPTPAALFTDHMVLQRDQPVPVWGTANPGEEIIVSLSPSTGSGQAPSTGSGQAPSTGSGQGLPSGAGLGVQKKTAKADAAGKWMVKLDPLKASTEPCELIVQSNSRNLKSILTDVLVGDVWLCSGQSNMGLNVLASLNPEQEIAAAQFPNIRLYSVDANPTLQTPANVKGHWSVCSPQSIPGFSAVAYFFGRELHRDLNVPIGLLHSSVGATRVEAWTRLEALRKNPLWAERAEKEIAQIKSQEEDSRNFVSNRAAWEEKNGVVPPPISEAARGWADPALDTSDWASVKLPATWGQLGAKSGGVFWVRKEVTLPESMAGKPAGLGLNWVSEQYDTAFFNGVEVGHANEKAPDFYNVQRGYRVPANLVKAGRNVIAVRVVSATQNAGMWVSSNPMGLPFSDPQAHETNWVMKTESTFAPLAADAFKTRPKINNLPFRDVSSALYNGMIAPLIPFGIKGAIWYQGESNTPRSSEYREVLSNMISDWRAQWASGGGIQGPGADFPFLIQQLVNNGAPATDPNLRDSWAFLREAQQQVAASLPNCGMATGLELGSPFTIHPPNKQEVGKRLALVALEKVYGKNIESSGPRYESMKIEGSTIRVKFSHAKGLFAKEGPLKKFAIAGADKKFVWAEAELAHSTGSGQAGETVVVSSPEVKEPVAVRYGWAANPEGCNLFNDAGLSAAPFRTDSW